MWIWAEKSEWSMLPKITIIIIKVYNAVRFKIWALGRIVIYKIFFSGKMCSVFSTLGISVTVFHFFYLWLSVFQLRWRSGIFVSLKCCFGSNFLLIISFLNMFCYNNTQGPKKHYAVFFRKIFRQWRSTLLRSDGAPKPNHRVLPETDMIRWQRSVTGRFACVVCWICLPSTPKMNCFLQWWWASRCPSSYLSLEVWFRKPAMA